jgi:hypothetical protein
MICPRCQHPNEEVDIFCRECGARLVNVQQEPTLIYAPAPEAKQKPSPGDPTLAVGAPPLPPQFVVPNVTPPAQEVMTTPPARSSNTARIVMLTVIVTSLFLSLGAIIAVLFFRHQTDSQTARTAETSSNQNGSIPVETASPTIPTGNVNKESVAASPAQSPAPTPAVVDTSSARTEVLAAMNRWADSLRRRDLSDNLSLYADRLNIFYGRSGVDKSDVRANRQAIFAKYDSIDVRLSDLQLTIDSSGTTATVSYDNTYDWQGGAKSLSGKSHNEIVMSKIGGKWLITSEKHLKTYYEK